MCVCGCFRPEPIYHVIYVLDVSDSHGRRTNKKKHPTTGCSLRMAHALMVVHLPQFVPFPRALPQANDCCPPQMRQCRSKTTRQAAAAVSHTHTHTFDDVPCACARCDDDELTTSLPVTRRERDSLALHHRPRPPFFASDRLTCSHPIQTHKKSGTAQKKARMQARIECACVCLLFASSQR